MLIAKSRMLILRAASGTFVFDWRAGDEKALLDAVRENKMLSEKQRYDVIAEVMRSLTFPVDVAAIGQV